MSMKISRRTLLATGTASATLAALPVIAQETGTLYEVEIKNFKFNPKTLEVRPGDRIRWTNRDGAPHDAAALDETWRTPILRRGEAGEVTVTADMNTDYFCSVHPSMRATLKIIAV